MSRAAITKCMAGQHVLSHTDGPVSRVHLCTKDARGRMGCPERGMMPRKKQRERCQMQGGGGVSTGINAPKICSRRISRCVTPIAQTTNSRCIRAMQLILRVAVAPGSPRTTDATIMTPLYDYHRPDYCSLQPSRGRRCFWLLMQVRRSFLGRSLIYWSFPPSHQQQRSPICLPRPPRRHPLLSLIPPRSAQLDS